MIGMRIGRHRVIGQCERRHVGVIARQGDRRVERTRVGIDADAVAAPEWPGGRADRVGRESSRARLALPGRLTTAVVGSRK